MERKGRLGFVPPRYGDGVVGGAETVLREMAHGLAGRGWEVDILTTCARGPLHVGQRVRRRASTIDARRRHGPPVSRVVISTSRAERGHVRTRRSSAGRAAAARRQERWMNDDLRLPELFHHLLDEADSYRALVFAPYLFWPAFACGQVAPDRTILMPCLHDEPEAYLEIFHRCSRGSRGLWFLSDPERDLAAVDPSPPRRLRGHRLRSRRPRAATTPKGSGPVTGIDGPFVMYAGRREGGKNWDRMLDAFARAVVNADLPLQLVTMGHGVGRTAPGDRRSGDRPRLRQRAGSQRRLRRGVGLHPAVGLRELLAHDHGVVAGRNARASRRGPSAVNRWHCERSGAGLIYDDDDEFEECLRFVAEAPGCRGVAIAAPGPGLRARALHLAEGVGRRRSDPRDVVAVELTCVS